MTDNPVMVKALRKAIARVMRKAASGTQKSIGAILPHDPRQAHKAVKNAVYKKILGGNLSILDKKKASNNRARLARTRKLDSNPHQRGGNRVTRSARTEQLDTYFGSDRAFVLRFLNSGADRTSPSSQRRRGNRAIGNRGTITPANFFEELANNNLEKAVDELEELIYTELKKMNKI